MRIAVAGGAGYIGSVLVPLLVDHGYEVEVMDRLWFGNHLPPGVKVSPCELFECTTDDFAGFDQVIFLAGLSNDPMAEFSPAMNFTHNGALPSYLAYTAKKAGVQRFIYASSCSVYGYTVNELYHEDCPVTCGYPYGISKLQGERGVLQLQDEHFSTIALRQGTVCGHSPRMRFDLIVNTMFKNAVCDGAITINNPSDLAADPRCPRHLDGLLAGGAGRAPISGVFNVASGNYTVGTDRRHGQGRGRTGHRPQGQDHGQGPSGLPQLQGDLRASQAGARLPAQVLRRTHHRQPPCASRRVWRFQSGRILQHSSLSASSSCAETARGGLNPRRKRLSQRR